MKCWNCGTILPESAKYCSRCGSAQTFTQELISAAQNGDQNAISQLYRSTYNVVTASVKTMIRDEDSVLDIVQDAYIKGFQSLNQLEAPEQFRAWMKRIAVNKAKDYLKRKRPMLFSEMTSEEDDSPEQQFEDDRVENLPDVVIDRQETVRLMQEILDTLSEEQRVVVAMFYYDEMSVREIAEVLECSEGTIKSRLNYARKKIKARVEELEAQGTKLYSVSALPLLMLLFRNVEQYGEGVSPEVFNAICQTMEAGTTAGTGAGSAAVGAGASAGGGAGVTQPAAVAAAKGVAGAAGKTLALKIAAGVMAGLLVVGGAAVSQVVSNRRGETRQPSVKEYQAEVHEELQNEAQQENQQEVPKALQTGEHEETETEVPLIPEKHSLDSMSAPAWSSIYYCYEKKLKNWLPSSNSSQVFWRTVNFFVNDDSSSFSQYTSAQIEGNFYWLVERERIENAAYAMFPDFDGELPALAEDIFYDPDRKLYGVPMGDGSVVIKMIQDPVYHSDGSVDAVYCITPWGDDESLLYTVHMLPNDHIDISSDEAVRYYYRIQSVTMNENGNDLGNSKDEQAGVTPPANANLTEVYRVYAQFLQEIHKNNDTDDRDSWMESYSVVDLNRDGIPEVIANRRAYPEMLFEVYTFQNGQIKWLNSFDTVHTWLYQDDNGNAILQNAWMGAEGLYRISYDGQNCTFDELSGRKVGPDEEYTKFPVFLENDCLGDLDLKPLAKACGMK